MTKLIAHTFHRQDMQVIALLRKKRMEARVRCAVCAVVGIVIGILWTQWQYGAELERIQRAYLSTVDVSVPAP